MGGRDPRHLRRCLPGDPGKRYAGWQLPDPRGEPLARVREIRDDIASRVDGLVEELDRVTDVERTAGRADTPSSGRQGSAAAIVREMDRAAPEAWIRSHVEPVGPVETAHERPWSTVLRVPLAERAAWFKACGAVQAFEPRLTAGLGARWPGRVADVLAHDEDRAWLLLADAGTPLRARGNPPEAWLEVLPPYAELQRGEVAHAGEHLAHGVPDLRLAALPSRYEELLRSELPLEPAEIRRLIDLAPRFADLCAELAARDVPETIQHDDLHHANVYEDGRGLRVLDWGDASVAHPFFSLVVTYRFLEEQNGLEPGDPWFARLRDAYLEPWGPGLAETFALAVEVGAFAHAIAWARQREHLPAEERPDFDTWFAVVLRRALRPGP
jgi:phosphotransferase family enzyme